MIDGRDLGPDALPVFQAGHYGWFYTDERYGRNIARGPYDTEDEAWRAKRAAEDFQN